MPHRIEEKSSDHGEIRPNLPASLVALLAAAAGLTVANLYYAQPLLPLIAAGYGVSDRAVGLVPMLTQIGYATGMLFLAPLGDGGERRRLIVTTTAAAALASLVVAGAPSLGMLLVASFALGVATVSPQLLVPYAATAAGPSARGRAIGTVMSGLLIGILGSRTLAGSVGARYGWRATYVLAAAILAILAVLLRLRLPQQHPEHKLPYRELLRSLPGLFARTPLLRRHAALGALGFAAFSVFWTTLAFHLLALPGHFGSAVAGLYGLVGIAGALAASVVGRFADRRDPRPVNAFALCLIVVAFAVFGFAGSSLVTLAAGVVLLDLGAQANHVANQTRIFGLDPGSRTRFNTLYMVLYFAGGAAGSTLGAWAWSAYGWTGVSILGAILAALGLAGFVLLKDGSEAPNVTGSTNQSAPPA